MCAKKSAGLFKNVTVKTILFQNEKVVEDLWNYLMQICKKCTLDYTSKLLMGIFVVL